MRKIVVLVCLSLLVGMGVVGCGRNTMQTISAPSDLKIINLAITTSWEAKNIQYGESVKFDAVATNLAGGKIGNINPRWSVLGKIGTIDELGNFVADGIGLGTIEALLQNIKTQALIEVHWLALVEAFDKINNYYLYPDNIPDTFKGLYGLSLEAILFTEYHSIEGFVNSLGDPYTRYVSAGQDQLGSVLNPGSFGGIGIVLKTMSNKIVISYVIPEQPAAKIGLKTGDVIIKVDGNPVEGLKVSDVSNMIRGQIGSIVTLNISRGGVSLEFSIKRESIDPKNVYGNLLEQNIGYIKIITFGSYAAYDFQQVYGELSASMEALIIDLRGNGGGYLNSVIEIADKFVPEGNAIIWYKQRDDNLMEITADSATKNSLPITLLVDEKTASAAEILAKALIDNNSAKSIGETTCGKGTIQSRFILNNGASLYVTIAEYFGPGQEKINGIGIIPDQVVAMSDQDFFNGNDYQLKAALAGIKQRGVSKAQSFAASKPIQIRSSPLPITLNNGVDEPITDSREIM